MGVVIYATPFLALHLPLYLCTIDQAINSVPCKPSHIYSHIAMEKVNRPMFAETAKWDDDDFLWGDNRD
jgi:hypothetical protein